MFLVAVDEGRIPAGSLLIVEGLDRVSRAEPIQAQAQLAQIQPPPQPAAWFMAEHDPDLNPAHAQRIIGITDAGDQGLIALAACQDYAKQVSTLK